MRPVASRIRELFHYDPTTGRFRWKIRGHGRRDRCGSPTRNGGWRLRVNGIEYPAAVIAFVYMTGKWPKGEVDHRDRDRANNRWDNLRDATKTQNHANRGNFPHSSPYKGVHFDTQTGRWRASITVNYKMIALGRHDSPELAHAAYVEAGRKIFGEFFRAA